MLGPGWASATALLNRAHPVQSDMRSLCSVHREGRFLWSVCFPAEGRGSGLPALGLSVLCSSSWLWPQLCADCYWIRLLLQEHCCRASSCSQYCCTPAKTTAAFGSSSAKLILILLKSVRQIARWLWAKLRCNCDRKSWEGDAAA